jgi:hypothetical protein
MSEQLPKNDFRENIQDMPPEANTALSQGHLLRWAMENGRYHINEGQVVVDDGESEEERREAELRALQLKLSREEAGEQRRSRWPEAS